MKTVLFFQASFCDSNQRQRLGGYCEDRRPRAAVGGGGFAAYAYVDWYLPIEWSDERGDAFERIVACNGKRFFRHRMKRPEGKSYQDDLAKWLKTLPTLCGVFAVNDRTAGCVISAAQKAGLDVPHDLAVVGVDNDVMLCENSPVPFSSIPMDREGGGRTAAELLDRRMQGRKVPLSGRMEPLPLVRRASTRRFADAPVGSLELSGTVLKSAPGANVEQDASTFIPQWPPKWKTLDDISAWLSGIRRAQVARAGRSEGRVFGARPAPGDAGTGHGLCLCRRLGASGRASRRRRVD